MRMSHFAPCDASPLPFAGQTPQTTGNEIGRVRIYTGGAARGPHLRLGSGATTSFRDASCINRNASVTLSAVNAVDASSVAAKFNTAKPTPAPLRSAITLFGSTRRDAVAEQVQSSTEFWKISFLPISTNRPPGAKQFKRAGQ